MPFREDFQLRCASGVCGAPGGRQVWVSRNRRFQEFWLCPCFLGHPGKTAQCRSVPQFPHLEQGWCPHLSFLPRKVVRG